MQISHLLYADDTLIFCDAKAEQVSYIKVVLVIFEAVSGLAVNWAKSSIFQVKEVANIQMLGMPLGNNHKELVIWD